MIPTYTRIPGQARGLVSEVRPQFVQTQDAGTDDQAFEVLDTLSEEQWSSLNDLGSTLSIQFKQTGQLADLEEAVVTYRKALSLQAETHPDRSLSLRNLAIALHTRFENIGQLSDITEAVSMLREALKLCSAPHPGRSSLLNTLASVLHTQLEQSGLYQELDEVVSLHHEALVLRPVPHPDRSSTLNNLAMALVTRFQQNGQLLVLNEAIELLHQTLFLQPSPHPDRSLSLSNLATCLENRFGQTGQLQDLDEAISLIREALASQSDTHPFHLLSLNNLAMFLQTRFGQIGRLLDLDEAVLMHRKALTFQPAHYPNRARTLSNLATTLQTRSKNTGQQPDLEEAIVLHRESLALRAAHHPDRPPLLNNLATALQDRYKQTDQRQDLDEVVSLYREVLGLQPTSYVTRSIPLHNLAMSLRTRYGETGHRRDLDEAISLHREALALRPTPHADRWSSLRELAVVLGEQFLLSRQLSDVEEAITLCHEALQTLPEVHPGTCIISYTLAFRLLEKFLWIAEFGDKSEVELRDMVSEVMDAFRMAVHCGSASVSERFDVARQWAAISHDLSFLNDSTLEAHETALSLLPRLEMLGLDVKSRQGTLASRMDGLACDAAACAIEQGGFVKAIEFLEQGRAVFWSQALQLRTPLDEVESVAPDLASKLKGISRVLEQGSLRDVSGSRMGSLEQGLSAESEAIRYRQLNTEWLATVEEVRRINGFQSFLHAKSFTKLSAAAAHGPIVILNASELRSGCDALILRHSQDPIHIPLGQMTVETAENLVKKIRTLTGSSLPLARGDSDRHMQMFFSSRRGDPDSIFRDVLGKLWTLVVQPIFRSLKLEKSDSPPRLWWLPTGPFASLPVHAAGIYDIPGSECAADYVVSSYTPTLSALLTSASRVIMLFKMLAAIQPVVSGHPSLPFTEEELRKIEEHVPKEYLIKFGTPDAPARVNDLLSELPNVSIAHFACHGVQDMKNPLESALILDNDHLKVSQLMQLSMSSASLVFLSACQTAMVGEDVPDEAMHLAATLLFCGFHGAVATMWSIKDRDGPTIAESFYHHLFSTPQSETEDKPRTQPDVTRAAHALHLAVNGLRNKLCAEEVPSQFVRWVPFIHLGL